MGSRHTGAAAEIGYPFGAEEVLKLFGFGQFGDALGVPLFDPLQRLLAGHVFEPDKVLQAGKPLDAFEHFFAGMFRIAEVLEDRPGVFVYSAERLGGRQDGLRFRATMVYDPETGAPEKFTLEPGE